MLGVRLNASMQSVATANDAPMLRQVPARALGVQVEPVPWIGFPVGYAVSGILLTIGGCFAMVLAG